MGKEQQNVKQRKMLPTCKSHRRVIDSGEKQGEAHDKNIKVITRAEAL